MLAKPRKKMDTCRHIIYIHYYIYIHIILYYIILYYINILSLLIIVYFIIYIYILYLKYISLTSDGAFSQLKIPKKANKIAAPAFE